MEGIGGIGARISQIETRIASMAALGNPTVVRTATATIAATGTSAGGAAGTGGTSFATALADAVANTGPTIPGAVPAGVGSGKVALNAKGIPTQLAAYGNGKIPAHALDRIGDTGHRLWAPAAASLESMLAAAKRDGIKIGITDSYRSYEEQVDLVRRKGLYSQGGLAAKPGTSQHGWGMAVDLDLNSKAQAWMRANGAKFGFVEDTPREPWHWGYHPTS